MRQAQEIVIVGCGAVAQQFYKPALRSLERVGVLSVKAVVDPSPTALKVLSAAFPQATAAQTTDALKLGPGVLAVIASPPRFHAEQTLEAFRRGWHVLCEKPMATTLEEAQRMASAAEKNKRTFAVGLYKRFFPTSRYIRDICHGKQLGELLRITATEGGAFRWPAASTSFFDKRQSFGGVLADVGIHLFDLLGWWIGPPNAVTYADDAMGGLESNSWVQLAYSGGARAMVHLSRDWQTDQRYILEFEGGVLVWKVNDASGLTLSLSGTEFALDGALYPSTWGSSGACAQVSSSSNAFSFIAQIRNVVAAIEGKENLVVPGAEAIDSLKLVLRCYASRSFLEQPWLPPNEAARARQLA